MHMFAQPSPGPLSLVPSPTSGCHFILGDNKMAAGSGAGNETRATVQPFSPIMVCDYYGIHRS